MAGGIEGEGRRGEPTPHQPRQPENLQPLQGRAAGRDSLQGPTTVDGHEPDAYKHDPAIFQSRTLEGIKALREVIERRVGIHTDRNVDKNLEDEADQLAEIGNTEAGTDYYRKGLLDAFNLIVDYIRGDNKSPEQRKRQTRLVYNPKKETLEEYKIRYDHTWAQKEIEAAQRRQEERQAETDEQREQRRKRWRDYQRSSRQNRSQQRRQS
jgi:hypothetical protein